MKKLAITTIKDCREELQKYGEITYEPKLLDNFFFYDTNETIEFIETIDGVVEAREQFIYRVDV